MTTERADELAKMAFGRDLRGGPAIFKSGVVEAILLACAEERADLLKNEFICAKCQLRQDSTREIKHDF